MILHTLLRLGYCGRPRPVHSFVVNAASDSTPNAPYFINHAKAVAQNGHLARCVMIPAHGNLAQPQAGKMRETDQFDVKAEAIDLRRFDQRPAYVHAKGFEAALRVPERQAGRRTNDEIENSSALFTTPRLVCANQAAIERA